MKRQSFIAAQMGGSFRTAAYQGHDHMIVPVVALVEGVLYAMNAPAPELVLAETFSAAPQGWNGRPVMMNHPAGEGGTRVSANDPKVLEAGMLGQVFNTYPDGNRLKMEAWLNLSRAAAVAGGDDLIARLRAGETVEVSVGVFVNEEPRQGVHDGKPYKAVWREIVPDHLAMLPQGTIGACSNEMGCGASARHAAAKEIEMAKAADAATTPKPKTWAQKFAEFMTGRAAAAEGQSDGDLRNALEKALRAVEPGFLGVDAVFPDDKLAVYAVMPGEALQYFERTYEVGEDGAVTLGGDATEVKPVTKFEPLKVAAASCCASCANTGHNHNHSRAAAGATEKNDMAEVNQIKRDRVARVLARLAAKAPKMFKAADAAVFEHASDERIAELEAQAAELEAPTQDPAPAPVPTPKPADPSPAPTPAEAEAKYLASAPDSIRAIVDAHKAAEATKRADLVGKMKAAQSAFTPEELSAMPLQQLQKFADALATSSGRKVLDFGAQGAPRAAAENDENDIPDAPSLWTGTADKK